MSEIHSLPVIDVSPALGDSNPQERAAVARALHEVLHETGFMYVTGHGLDADLLADAFRSASITCRPSAGVCDPSESCR